MIMLDLSSLSTRERRLCRVNPGAAGSLIEILLSEQFGFSLGGSTNLASPDLIDAYGATYQVKTACGRMYNNKKVYSCTICPSRSKINTEEYINSFDYFIFVSLEPFMECNLPWAPVHIIPASNLIGRKTYEF